MRQEDYVMTRMKRARSPDSDEDSYDDEQDYQKDGCPSQSYQISDRKKRRGVIEKRRRDRINNSLCELRRLVPTAFEKQGSAKLEKAEILQMTVDHLKLLQSKGLTGYNVDTATMALEYRMAGFRECATEVARYLVSIEGMDLQDPLRLRLLSHLQCYCAQREAAVVAKTTMPPNPAAASWNGQYVHPGTMAPQGMGQPGPHHMDQSGAIYVDHPCHRIPQQHRGDGQPGGGGLHGGGPVGRLPVSSGGVQMQASSSSISSQMAHQMLAGIPTQFLGVNSMSMISPNGLHYHSSASSSSSSTSNLLGQGVKPYRPWGAELVY